MKILMLTPYLPYPPSSGGQIRSYNLIKYLSKRHEITLFSLVKNKDEEAHIKELRPYCREVSVFFRPEKPWTLSNILKTGFSLNPFLVVRNMATEEKKKIAEKLGKEKFDLIHAETFYVMPHLPKNSTPVILVDQTIEFEVYRHFVETMKWRILRPLLSIDIFKLKHCETKFWRQANRVVAVSEADRKVMRACVPGLRVDIIPNAPGEDLVGLYEKKPPPDLKKPIIFFPSNFLWMQNVEGAEILAKKVFPLIKKKNPAAVCRIVGQYAAKKIGHLSGEGIEIIDIDASDIESVWNAYLSATVFVAPLWGPGGTRLKILGAMAAGVPVVTTSVGIEGIDASPEKNVLVSDDYEKMADYVDLLLKNPVFYKKIVTAARELIEKKYRWEKIAGDLEKIYEEIKNGN